MNLEDLIESSISISSVDGRTSFIQHLINGKVFSIEPVVEISENHGFTNIFTNITGYLYYIDDQVVDEATYHEAYQAELTKLKKSTR